MKDIIAIDGVFIEGKRGGQERFAFEILRELDKICACDELEIVIPKSVSISIPLKNIKVVKYGGFKGILWEQIDFYSYLLKYKRKALYLLNRWPVFRPDYPVIHDCIWFDCRHIYKNTYGKISRLYHQILFRMVKKRANKVITVSNFSKQSIIRNLDIDPKRILVAYNSWQHFARIKEDDSIFDRYCFMNKGDYYLSVSSLTPQKNFIWVIEVAKRNPVEMFVVIGEKVGLTNLNNGDIPENIYFLGFVNDSEMKAAMRGCKAFLHPATYEGFGIPPLEAISVGAKVVVSFASCMPEIYGNSVYYIDPYDYDVNLDMLINREVESGDTVLNKYSWEDSAGIIYKNIIGIDK